jgi:hypothetical protein
MTFGATGGAIIFNMMNEMTNNFAGLAAFMRWYRVSALYMEIDYMVM